MGKNSGKHVIKLDLHSIPPSVSDVFIVLSAYECADLSRFPPPVIRLFDAENSKHELARYQLASAGSAPAVIMCVIRRGGPGGGWLVDTCSRTSAGTVRDYSPIKAAIAPIQMRHARWRHRRLMVMMHRRAQGIGGALQPLAGCEDENEAAVRLFELPAPLFRAVVGFL
jgi:hypothetical protein